MQQHLEYSHPGAGQRMTAAEPGIAAVTVDGRHRRLRALRLGSALVTLLSVAALGVMAVSGGRTVTKHTITVIKKIEAADRRSFPVPSDPAPSVAGSATDEPALVGPTTLASSAIGASASPAVTAAAVTAPVPGPGGRPGGGPDIRGGFAGIGVGRAPRLPPPAGCSG